MSAAKLYTPELLALAVDLAEWPLSETAPLQGEARSATCGSTLAVGLALDETGRIETIGMRVRACAVGQASAAIFARHAVGADLAAIRAAADALEAWLKGGAEMPDWPGLATIEPARAYPARHGAMLLPWKASLAALSTTARAG